MDIIAIQIVTDSTCDVSREDQEKLGIHIVPLTIHFKNESFVDGVDLTREEFYDKLDAAEELPTTSMPSIQAFEDVFRPIVEAGDEVLAIMVSSGLSGTYQGACIAADNVGGNITVLDSRTTSLSLHLLVVEAVKFKNLGYAMGELTKKMKELISRVTLYAGFNTLKNLRKGGRISSTAAVMGEMLHIKPIITVTDGMPVNVGKARGMKAATKYVVEKALSLKPDFSHHVVFAYSGKPHAMEKLMEAATAVMDIKNYSVCAVGGIVATYVGLDCMGMAFVQEEVPANS